MAVYEFKCNECQTRIEVVLPMGEAGDVYGPCDQTFTDEEQQVNWRCQGELRRVFAVNVNRPMQEHFNSTLQRPISSMRQFENELRKESDKAWESTGIPCSYAPVDKAELIKEVPPVELPKVSKDTRVVGGFIKSGTGTPPKVTTAA